MGKSQKKRLIEAHIRTARQYKLIPYQEIRRGGIVINKLHIESK